MAKIINFRSSTDNVLSFLDEVKEEVKDLNIDNMIIACKCNDKYVLTGYTRNLDLGTKQELLGHIQIDIINQMIKENYITPD